STFNSALSYLPPRASKTARGTSSCCHQSEGRVEWRREKPARRSACFGSPSGLQQGLESHCAIRSGLAAARPALRRRHDRPELPGGVRYESLSDAAVGVCVAQDRRL